ncbi:MAG TPA: amidophosphoribosyltransferase [Candidatus Limnocylindrales bacterium]|nr:amidophosphoribosyltransferase [Candidatus Limnocylindrales bacterium]
MAEVEMHEECGVVGLFAAPEHLENLKHDGSEYGTTLVDHAYWALEAVQNRGRDSAGLAANSLGSIAVVKDFGSIPEALPPASRDTLPQDAQIVLGQNRYATAVTKSPSGIQPFKFKTQYGDFALGHNGNLVNDAVLAVRQGYKLPIPSDSWLIGAMTAEHIDQGYDLTESLTRVLPQLKGAFSVVATHGDTLVGARDPNGFRPLHLGRLAGAYVLASETGSLYSIGAEETREIEPGEMITISPEGVESQTFATSNRSSCAFEYLYFARPDQKFNGRSVREARLELGRQLAHESSVDADLVIGVPYSGRLAGEGYAAETGLPDVQGLIKVEDIRSFIAETQAERVAIARRKLQAVPELMAGKRVVLTEDSIVRGTSLFETVRIAREGGAREVHVRVASPPILWPCFYGVSMESKEELIAAQKSVDEIREHIGADSLEYLSLDGLKKAIGIGDDVCTACFDGSYPTALPPHLMSKVA